MKRLGDPCIPGRHLARVTKAENVLVDMKCDVVDASGNTTSFVMAPAFAVGRDSAFGRRGPRR